MRIFGTRGLFFLFSGLIWLMGCQSAQPPQKAQPSAPVSELLSILQGSTDATSTVLNIVAPKNKKYKLSIHFDSTVLQTPPIQEKQEETSNWKLLTITLKGLNPGSLYILKVIDESSGQIIDQRSFKTYSSDLKKPNIAMISCLDETFEKMRQEQWQEIWDKKPDAIFLIGANVAIDAKGDPANESPSSLWEQHIETRLSLDLYHMKRLIPIFAAWDTYGYGLKSNSKGLPFKEISKTTFELFYPLTENTFVKRGPGISSAVKLGKKTFISFDDRNFYSFDKQFANRQEAWFFSLLKKNKGPFWLLSGALSHPSPKFQKKLKDSKKKIILISKETFSNPNIQVQQ
jgi:hypothetical protein